MGGRGANSGYGGGTNTGNGTRGPSRFFDKTAKYKGMTMHQFENAIRDKKVEYIGLYDKDGKLIVAGTSENSHAVAIPINHPDFGKAYTLTHNHPYAPSDDPERTIGGTFSTADVRNHIRYGFKGETRAVSNGPNENTYIFRVKPGVKQDTAAFLKHADQAEAAWKMTARLTVKSVEDRLAKQKRALPTRRENQIVLGVAKHAWKSDEVAKSGYEYIEVKKPHW